MSQPNYGGDIQANYGGDPFSDSQYTEGGSLVESYRNKSWGGIFEGALLLLLLVAVFILISGTKVPEWFNTLAVVAGLAYLGYEGYTAFGKTQQ